MKLKASALFTILSILACKDDDGGGGNVPCNCSDASTTTTFTVGTGKVFLPNVLTPNGDGFNDSFFPLATDGIDRVSIKITDNNGAVMVEYNSIQPNDPTLGWPQGASSTYDGIIKYTITAQSTDGTSVIIKGTACSKPYNLNALPTDWEGCDNCRFSTQHDGMGGFCETCPPLENICQ